MKHLESNTLAEREKIETESGVRYTVLLGIRMRIMPRATYSLRR